MCKFVYLNINPDNAKKQDCVTRAISLASGLPYPTIRKKLFHTARLLDCEKLCMTCYKHLIEDVFKYCRVNCDGMSVEEFADKNPVGIYLARIEGHITTLIDNNCFDIWDCRSSITTDVWRVD